jgi:hypothetical protein
LWMRLIWLEEVIAFVSQKFSKTARAWSTYEKEASGMSTFMGNSLRCSRTIGIWCG